MNENEQKAGSVADQKSKIRERYKIGRASCRERV